MSRSRTLNPKPGAREQMTLEFSENALLPALAGAHSRHFVRLEQQCNVRIASRGNLISVEGDAKARAQAAAVLRALYARLEAGDDIGMADVEVSQ